MTDKTTEIDNLGTNSQSFYCPVTLGRMGWGCYIDMLSRDKGVLSIKFCLCKRQQIVVSKHSWILKCVMCARGPRAGLRICSDLW